MGLQAHHHFIADPEIPLYVIMARRIPCLCDGCSSRLKKDIVEQYCNPCNDCKYWSIYKGWNDWRTINFKKETKCELDDVISAKEWTLQSIGGRMAQQIRIGMYGAYLVDDRIRYYLVQWTCNPWLVENGSLETDGELARKGEWVCKGVWMNDINRAPCWFWQSEKEVVVRCQSILCSDVRLIEHSSDNDLPQMNGQYRLSMLALNPIRLSDENHDILMDAASLRDGLDYKEEVPDDCSDESDSLNPNEDYMTDSDSEENIIDDSDNE